MNAGNILIVDDEEQLRRLLKRIVSLEGYDVYEASGLQAALQIMQSKPVDVMLCDVKLADGNGVHFTATVKSTYPTIEIILLTAYGNIPDGILAMKNGAFDYIVKGDDNNRILPLLAQALERVKAARLSAVRINEKTTSFDAILGTAALTRHAVLLARKTAPTDATVLLLGETGTGKEVFAGAIHQASKRSNKSFIAVNCSTFSRDLLEGELFGYKAGAYTGAVKDKKGIIELADQGTLFLDEIGEMNPDLQAKLLRVLENGEFIKLGDVRTTRVDVRIIAATNRDLAREVEAGHFREDLYYRLNVLAIHLPPLRDRREDIQLLAAFFLERLAGKAGTPPLQISASALDLMQRHGWKGNIRELRNVLERAAILAENGVILPADLPFTLQPASAGTPDQTLASVEKQHIRKVLAHTGGNKTEAARLLDIGLTTLYRKLEEYKLTDRSDQSQ